MENEVVLSAVVERVRAVTTGVVGWIDAVVRAATRPAPVVIGLLRDLTRSREELVAENALLRQQLIVAARATKRPTFAPHERGVMVLLARVVHLHHDYRRAA